MGKEQPVQIFMPPNILKAKVGGSGVLDTNTIKRAEQALVQLKEEFAGWMAVDVSRLSAARDTYQAQPSSTTLGVLYRASHDLKGQGTTFDYPLVSRVASSLCRLTDEAAEERELPMHLIDAHVEAIKIFVRDGIKNANASGVAKVLTSELEQKVDAFLA
jgi:hypothetical protein